MAIDLLKIDPDSLEFSVNGSSDGSITKLEETQMSLDFESADDRSAKKGKGRDPEKYRHALKDLSIFRDLEQKLDSLLKGYRRVVIGYHEEKVVKII